MARRIFFTILLGGVFLCQAGVAQAGHGTNLVISEVQITGGTGLTGNDFVEIYNPTGVSLDLNGIRLVKRTATGTSDTTLKSWTVLALVPAHGYYLWANSGFSTIGAPPDATTSGTIAADNGVALRQGPEDTGVIIDAVAWGTASNAFVEGVVFAQNPGANESIERKPGGGEGNGTDTNVNAADFFLLSSPNPKNSTSAAVPAIGGGSEAEPPQIDIAPVPPPPPPTYTAGDFLINEFTPDPSSGDEWIELHNTTSGAIDLTGWKVFDGTGNAIKTLEGSVQVNGFVALDLASARLNNSGDTIILKAPDETVIDTVSYGDWNDGNVADNAPVPSKSGQSVARKSAGIDTGNDKEDFALSDSPTKSTSNVITVTTMILGSGTVPTSSYVVPNPKIVINEFVADPEDDEEWVELFNAGQVTLELDGWYLEDGSETKTKLSGTFVPDHFKVISQIKGNLNNKGDIIRLKNDKGEVIDRVAYGVWEDGTPSDNAPLAEDPNSVARREDGKDTDNDKEDFAVTTKVTKGKENVIEAQEKEEVEASKASEAPKAAKASEAARVAPKATTAPIAPEVPEVPDVVGKLLISEVLPDPEGSDENEFIELYFAGETELNLKGFRLDDEEGGSRGMVFGERAMVPRSYLVALKRETGISLNNRGDAVRLFDPKGVEVANIEYEGSVSGRSFARREDGQWLWTSPTPGTINTFDDEAVADPEGAERRNAVVEISLAQMREEELGTRVSVQGIVSVIPGVLGSQIFYIAGPGVQVYMYKKDFPDLLLGDHVRIEGVVGEAGGERRMKVQKREDIQIVRHGKPPTPIQVRAEDITEEIVGDLVSISGTVIEVNKSGMVLDDDIGETTVAIKPTTDIDMSNIVPGTQVIASGIVSSTKTGFRLLPRFQEDIAITGMSDPIFVEQKVQPDEDKEGKESSPYAKATAAGGGALAVAAVARRRKLLLAGARAILFIVKRGKNNGLS